MSKNTTGENKDTQTIAGLVIIVWMLALTVFLLWAWVFAGAGSWIIDVWQGTIGGSTVTDEGFGHKKIIPLLGFVGAELLVTLGTLPLILLIVGKSGFIHPVFRKLLAEPWLRFKFALLGMVLREEVVFRWFPLAVLIVILPAAQVTLTILIVVSSIVFALVHLTNHEPERRHPIVVLPQLIGGFFLAYAFLRWGFAGAVFAHYSFNFLILVGIKAAYNIHPAIIEQTQKK